MNRWITCRAISLRAIIDSILLLVTDKRAPISSEHVRRNEKKNRSKKYEQIFCGRPIKFDYIEANKRICCRVLVWMSQFAFTFASVDIWVFFFAHRFEFSSSVWLLNRIQLQCQIIQIYQRVLTIQLHT